MSPGRHQGHARCPIAAHYRTPSGVLAAGSLQVRWAEQQHDARDPVFLALPSPRGARGPGQGQRPVRVRHGARRGDPSPQPDAGLRTRSGLGVGSCVGCAATCRASSRHCLRSRRRPGCALEEAGPRVAVTTATAGAWLQRRCLRATKVSLRPPSRRARPVSHSGPFRDSQRGTPIPSRRARIPVRLAWKHLRRRPLLPQRGTEGGQTVRGWPR